MPGKLTLPRDIAASLEDAEGNTFLETRGVVHGRAATQELLDLATTLAPDGMGDDTPYFWQAHISTDIVDSYGTSMQPSSLKNYAADASEGRAFMNAHNWDTLPIGYSLTGKYAGSTGGDGVKKAIADFYTIRDYNPNANLNTDELIRGMQRGLIRDVSIGWLGGRVMCSICARDMWADWNCWHIPGFEYELRDEEGHKTGEKRMAVGLVEDAHLAEVSAVFDGATPGALISKLYREIEARRLTPAGISVVERRFRVPLPDAIRQYQAVSLRERAGPAGAPAADTDPVATEDDDMPQANKSADPANTPPPNARGSGNADPPAADVAERAMRFLRDAFYDRGIPVEPTRVMDHINEIAEEVREARTALVRHRATDAETIPQAFDRLSARINDLTPQAKDGVAYRENCIKNAVESAVRAFGSDTDEAEYRSMLEAQPIERIVKMGEQWEAIARKALPAGRQTGDPAPSNGNGKVETIQVGAPDFAHTS